MKFSKSKIVVSYLIALSQSSCLRHNYPTNEDLEKEWKGSMALNDGEGYYAIFKFPTQWSEIGLEPSQITLLTLPNKISVWPQEALHEYTNLEELCPYGEALEALNGKGIALTRNHFIGQLPQQTLRSLYLPSLVTTIGKKALARHSNLKEVFLPLSLNRIDEEAFTECKSLTTVDFSACQNLQSVGSKAFWKCVSLPKADLSTCKKLRSIGKGAFSSCINLESVNLSGCTELEAIERETFNDCLNLKEVVLPRTLKTIGCLAFCGCTSLERITLPDSLEVLNSHAFTASGLTSIKLPHSLKTLDKEVFFNCSNLKSIQLSPLLKSLEWGTFGNCSSLQSIDLSVCRKLTTIGYEVFKGCTRLKQITFPVSLQTIELRAFENCSCLEFIDLSKCKKLKIIEKCVFKYCTNLTSIKLPPSLQTLDDWVFEGCINLKLITLPASLKVIGKNAFEGCDNLKQIIWEGDPSRIHKAEETFPNELKHFRLSKKGRLTEITIR